MLDYLDLADRIAREMGYKNSSDYMRKNKDIRPLAERIDKVIRAMGETLPDYKKGK